MGQIGLCREGYVVWEGEERRVVLPTSHQNLPLLNSFFSPSLIIGMCLTPPVDLDGKCDGTTLLQNHREPKWSLVKLREVICQTTKP